MIKNKAILIICIVAIILVAGLLVWKFASPILYKGGIPNLPQSNFEIPAAKTLPEINPLSNPVKNKLPALNPVERINPFTGFKVNPFK